MLKILENISCLTTTIILTTSWIFTSSVIIYIVKLISKIKVTRTNILIVSIIAGIALELLLSFISLLFNLNAVSLGNTANPGIISGFRLGLNITILLSPVSSIAGAALGMKKKRLKLKLFP